MSVTENDPAMLGGSAGMHIDVVLTLEDKDGKQTHHNVKMELSVEEQRKLVERELGAPCFRMWMTEAEKTKVLFAIQDWTCYQLRDGRWAVWRKEADLEVLKAHGEMTVYANIQARRLTDEVL